VRPRKGKAREQVNSQRDRLWEDHRHGGSRERRQGQSRVRAWYNSAIQYDSEEDYEYNDQEATHDGRVIIQYPRPGRV
jgi:hypothetical protein